MSVEDKYKDYPFPLENEYLGNFSANSLDKFGQNLNN